MNKRNPRAAMSHADHAKTGSLPCFNKPQSDKNDTAVKRRLPLFSLYLIGSLAGKSVKPSGPKR